MDHLDGKAAWAIIARNLASKPGFEALVADASAAFASGDTGLIENVSAAALAAMGAADGDDEEAAQAILYACDSTLGIHGTCWEDALSSLASSLYWRGERAAMDRKLAQWVAQCSPVRQRNIDIEVAAHTGLCIFALFAFVWALVCAHPTTFPGPATRGGAPALAEWEPGTFTTRSSSR